MERCQIYNLIANTLAILAILVFIIAGVILVVQRPYFSVQELDIEPAPNSTLHYVTVCGIRALLADQLSGNFFTINLDDARRLFESAPWVRRAVVRRVWPNALRVSIEEQQPLSLWNENQMINTWGESFTANTGVLDDDLSLVRLCGPDGAESLVVQRYAELARWFAPLDLHVIMLRLSPRYAWRAHLSNNMTLDLGRDPGADASDPHGLPGALPFGARIERFVHFLPLALVRLKGRRILHADLRYPNGFALKLMPILPLPSNVKLLSTRRQKKQ